jgi:hypothetical protein
LYKIQRSYVAPSGLGIFVRFTQGVALGCNITGLSGLETGLMKFSTE